MKILFVHTAYTERGGEDSVFHNEYELLSSHTDIHKVSFSNGGNKFKTALKFLLAPWNFSAAARLKKLILQHKPDVVHIHNWYFGGSPLLIRVVKKLGVPLVLTLHNYRLLCPSGTLFHQGRIFEESLKPGFPWKAVKNKVYRNSAFQTFWLAFTVYFHKLLKTWNAVDQYIALTPFARNLFLNSALNLRADQISVKPNFVEDKGYNLKNRSPRFLYVGRLTQDKGIEILLKAFAGTEHELQIIGDGPLKGKVLKAEKENSNIKYLGLRSNNQIINILKKSTALIFPSMWYEGMPMTIHEAFSTGTPVISSKLGAMETLIKDHHNGLFFEAGNYKDLREKLDHWNSLESKESFFVNARKTYEDKYTPNINLSTQLAIYNSAIVKARHVHKEQEYVRPVA